MTNNPSSHKFYLHEYKASDLESIVNLWYQTWHKTYPDLEHPNPIDVWRERLTKIILPESRTIIAKNAKGEIVGFMCIVVEENYLSQLFIDTRFQGQGIGTLLMNDAKTMCPSNISLHTLERNIQSQNFYEKQGFLAGEKSINSNNGQVNIWYHWQADN